MNPFIIVIYQGFSRCRNSFIPHCTPTIYLSYSWFHIYQETQLSASNLHLWDLDLWQD